MQNAWGHRPSLRSSVALAIVVAGHVLVVIYFSQVGWRRQPAESDRRLTMIVLQHPPRAEEPPVEKRPASRKRASQPVPRTPRHTAITLPAESPIENPAVDWRGEIDGAARRAIEGARGSGRQEFGDLPGPSLAKCAWRKPDMEWDPEPEEAGFAGGLPFVRLGKRCVVGLGFFGCGVGDLPEPDSNLFDKMHDPDRYTSSVPDLSECKPGT